MALPSDFQFNQKPLVSEGVCISNHKITNEFPIVSEESPTFRARLRDVE